METFTLDFYNLENVLCQPLCIGCKLAGPVCAVSAGVILIPASFSGRSTLDTILKK